MNIIKNKNLNMPSDYTISYKKLYSKKNKKNKENNKKHNLNLINSPHIYDF